jgi:ribose 5-phosphate isomerase B
VRIAFGTDQRTGLADAILEHLRRAGHQVEVLALPGWWPDVGRDVAEAVAEGRADRGIVCCWTGTGVSIAANKVEGIRAALCADAETARGARQWNDANVLALSIRLTTEPVAAEILDAFLSADADPSEADAVSRLN